MNTLIKDALLIPVSDPCQTISINPVILEVDGRPIPLELRITAPATGNTLPVVLLSHGHGPSLYLP
jgi:predicted dienelactone hydrolase